MALALPDAWTWDTWFVDDGQRFHAFYLKASRALQDPGRRHFRVAVGHAVSDNLRDWEEVADALIASDSPAFDDYTTWTGSIVRDPGGLWRLFYTGSSRAESGLIQRVGVATSDDLVTWHKASSDALLEADPRWYEKYESGEDHPWGDEAWRDPFVFEDPDGAGWHMLVTGRTKDGAPDERGVIGHATSLDLVRWQVRPPLSLGGSGFGQLEVPEIARIDGRGVLLFGCLTEELSRARRAAGQTGGIWAVPIDGLTGPYDITRATRLTDESLYCGRLVQDREGTWCLLAFHNTGAEGGFEGWLSDPLPVSWSPDGHLRVSDGRFDDLVPPA